MKATLISLWAALLSVTCTVQLHAQLPNAWQIMDPDGTSGSTPHYTTNLPAELQIAATNGGFRYAINSRMISSSTPSPSMIMLYGLGTERFLVQFNLNASGDLTAALEGGSTYTLTTNDTGNALYHTHEIIYNPESGKASYVFDGQVKTTNWTASSTDFASGAIFWGSGSSTGQGTMNFHSVTFEVTNNVVAAYDAGNSPTNAPDPETQGWTFVLGGAGLFFDVSPDDVPLPAIPMATTLAVTNSEPYQATLQGEIDQGNLAATTWFEWGTTTNYGNTTAPQALLSDTNLFPLPQTITGLTKGMTYHFRCVATNLQGIAYGEDQMFATPLDFSVSSLADSGDGSLRQSIVRAQPGDTITFATNGTITLSSGELLIAKNLTIVGPGPANLAVSGNQSSRVFNIAAGSTVEISGVTINDGKRPNGATGAAGGAGGGIYNFGTLTLSNCIVTNNIAGNGGVGSSPATGGGGTGGAGGDGGGIYNAASGQLTMIDCTVAGNQAGDGGIGGKGGDGVGVASPDGATGGVGGRGGCGGGIYNSSGSVSLIACTFNRNFAGDGGQGGVGGNGLLLGDGGPGGHGGTGGHGGGTYKNAGSFSVMVCTLYNNRAGAGGDGGNGGNAGTGGTDGGTGGGGDAGNGGGNYNNSDSLTLVNCTVEDNSTGYAGQPSGASGVGSGIYNLGILTMTNSIVADPVYGVFSGVNNFTNYIPQLSSLGNYGGLTPTLSPRPGSPVIDAGDDSVTNFLSADQRGYLRLVGAHVDIGAMEYLPSLVVTTNADAGPGSLREAIQILGWGGVITFSNNLNGQTITLTSGELSVEHELTIAGPGPENLAINGNGLFTILRIGDGDFNGIEATLDSLTLTNGHTLSNGGGLYVGYAVAVTVSNCTLVGNSAGHGAAIYGSVESRLILSNSTLMGNAAITYGGGIYTVDGYVTLTDSSISSNSASSGGGIYVGEGSGAGSMVLSNSTLVGNSATNGDGGGIHNAGHTSMRLDHATLSGNTATTNGGGVCTINTSSLQVEHSTISANAAGYGGGIYSRDAYSMLTNSTLSDNFAGDGGGIYSSGFSDNVTLEHSTLSRNAAVTNGGGIFITNSSNLTLKNSTLAGNSADSGGGIYSAGDSTHARLEHSTLSGNQAGNTGGGIWQNASDGSSLYFANTIVAGNVAAVSPDIFVGNTNQVSLSGSNLTNGIPLLALLGDYGGPTQTMPPLSGSSAIDAGADYYTNYFTTDQRGYPRLSGVHVDIGAVESQVASANNPPVMNRPDVSGIGALSLSLTNAPNLDFTVMASTNVALPLNQWLPIGFMSQSAPGEYLFIDSQATNYPKRFYQVVSP